MGNHYDPRDDETEVERARREGREEAERKQRMLPTPNLRDQFAMAAMTSLVHGDVMQCTQYSSWGVMAEVAYQIADAMLEARKEKP